MPSATPSGFLSVKQTAERLGLSVATVRRCAGNGSLPACKVSGARGGWLIDADALERQVAASLARQAAPFEAPPPRPSRQPTIVDAITELTLAVRVLTEEVRARRGAAPDVLDEEMRAAHDDLAEASFQTLRGM